MSGLRRAQSDDLPACYAICRQTGDAGADATAPGRDPDLLGHLYAAPYLILEPAFAWVVEDEEGVCGYALATPDSARFFAAMAAEWLPPLRTRYAGMPHPADASLVAQLHATPSFSPQLADWPAHLHVDLLPRAQGQGLGGKLMRAVLDDLRLAGGLGVHLGVDPRNERALNWYPRFGFGELFRQPGCVWMGMRLDA